MECLFYFDISCPYAYIASTRVEAIAKFSGVNIVWTPVLLGGLYRFADAPQGKDGSAITAVPSARKPFTRQALQTDILRYNINLSTPSAHPLSTVKAQRLLCSFPPGQRILLAKRLFSAYWHDNLDITSPSILLWIVQELDINSSSYDISETVFDNNTLREILWSNTETAFKHGAFGVPSFYIPKSGTFLFGQDRMHILQAKLFSLNTGLPLSKVPDLKNFYPRCIGPPHHNKAQLTPRTLIFWFDFSSPWSYLGWTQLERLQREHSNVHIEMRPVLVGALFKMIGTPLVPMEVLSVNAQNNVKLDLQEWSDYWSAVNEQEMPPLSPVNACWPSTFPLRSVLALRVALSNDDTVACIFRAAWRDDVNISNQETLKQVLNNNGFDGETLVHAACTSNSLKSKLQENTAQAKQLGLCGVPTFQIDTHFEFGQDRINVVQDLLDGWSPKVFKLDPKL